MDFESIEPVIIALLFASGDAVSLEAIANVIDMDQDILKVELDCIVEQFNTKNTGLTIKKINDTYQLASDPKYFCYTKKLFEPKQKQGLSQSALEILAIIAYNQGITRIEIEKIRGVCCDSGLSALLERELIKDAGRLDAPGRPIMYETTNEFLKCFGYTSLDELPKVNLKEEEAHSNDDNS